MFGADLSTTAPGHDPEPVGEALDHETTVIANPNNCIIWNRTSHPSESFKRPAAASTKRLERKLSLALTLNH